MKRVCAVLAMSLLPAGLHSTGANAEMSGIRMFGKDVAITTRDDEEHLTVEGRELLKNRYVSIDEIGIVGNVPVIIGSSSQGGNACEGATFVVSFPHGGAARLDGPLDECTGMGADLKGDHIEFSTAAIPGRDGKRWTWTPDGSFQEAGTTTFRADESKGWAQLRERQVGHPSDLLDYAEINRRVSQLAGPDKTLVFRILTGVGSGGFKGDWFVGQSCTPHMCTEEEAIVAASLSDRQLFLAWKPQGKKIVVRPPVKDWPEKAKAALREWAAKWK